MAERWASQTNRRNGVSRAERSREPAPMLAVRDLQVYYGESHAIQGVDLNLSHGILSLVGRNGMGKTTLCNAIMGLVKSRGGSIRLNGREIRGRTPNQIANLGVGYVPQGRRIFPSLTVDEHLRLAERGRGEGAWTIERIYSTFPRLAERRNNGGSQLSGGEQQMLAISRALLGNPHLLIMDEPTEGLAPVIVQLVERMLREIADDGDFAVLLVEQNIGVATEIAEHVAIMVNGQINRIMPANELASDRALQQQLLGVGRQAESEVQNGQPVDDGTEQSTSAQVAVPRVFSAPISSDRQSSETNIGGAGAPTRWGMAYAPLISRPAQQETRRSNGSATAEAPKQALKPPARVIDQLGRTACVAGTFDTKGAELMFLRDRLRERGVATRTIDLSTTRHGTRTDVSAAEIAACHPAGSRAVFVDDRGAAVAAMSQAFEIWITRQRDIGGMITAAGSGGTALAAPAMRTLAVGIPKIIISTVASGDIGPYVGPADIMMMYSVADIQGINSVTETILGNGAAALAGMIQAAPTSEQRRVRQAKTKPALGLTMFGVTTPSIQGVVKRLQGELDCLVFHATGVGGRSMEKLVDGGQIEAVMDLTTTELADMTVGGVFPATDDRMGAVIRTRIPYVGSVGALDMVNFGAMETVPSQFRQRKFVIHNPNVTLMRTTAEECRVIGEWIASRLNLMQGAVRFLLPEGGVSALDAPGQPFHDPAADTVLFDTIESNTVQTTSRRLIRIPANINDDAFVEAAVQALRQIYRPRT